MYCYDPIADQPCATPSTPTGLAANASSQMDVVTHADRIYVSDGDRHRGLPRRPLHGPLCGLGQRRRTSAAGTCSPSTTPSGVAIGVCVGPGRRRTLRDGRRAAVHDGGRPGERRLLRQHRGGRDRAAHVHRQPVARRPRVLGLVDVRALRRRQLRRGRVGDAGTAPTRASRPPTAPPGTAAAWWPWATRARSSPWTSRGTRRAPAWPTGSSSLSMDLRDQRCDATVGRAAWREVSLLETDPSGTELTSVRVRVLDAASGAELLTGDLVGGTGRLSLSGIDPDTHPSLRVEAIAVARTGDTAWADGVAPTDRAVLDGRPDAGVLHDVDDRGLRPTACGIRAGAGVADRCRAGRRRRSLSARRRPRAQLPRLRRPRPPRPRPPRPPTPIATATGCPTPRRPSSGPTRTTPTPMTTASVTASRSRAWSCGAVRGVRRQGQAVDHRDHQPPEGRHRQGRTHGRGRGQGLHDQAARGDQQQGRHLCRSA